MSNNVLIAGSKSWFEVSVEDYLEGERDASVKHEYVYGEVFALAGSMTTEYGYTQMPYL